MFLFLSGFGLYYSLSKKNSSLSAYYKSRFLRIFPEYWLFLLCAFFISMDFSHNSFCDLIWNASTIGYWIGKPSSHWYISCIVLFYALFPVYYRQFQKYGIKLSVLYVALGLLLIVLYGAIMVLFHDNENIGGYTILSISRIPVFIIGSLFGYAAKEQVDSKFIKRLIILFFCLSPFAVGALALSKLYFRDYLWTCSLYFIPFIAITPPLCLLSASLLDRIPKVFDKALGWVGALSLELYLVHGTVISKVFESNLQLSNLLLSSLGILLSFICAIALNQFNEKVFLKLFRNW